MSSKELKEATEKIFLTWMHSVEQFVPSPMLAEFFVTFFMARKGLKALCPICLVCACQPLREVKGPGKKAKIVRVCSIRVCRFGDKPLDFVY